MNRTIIGLLTLGSLAIACGDDPAGSGGAGGAGGSTTQTSTIQAVGTGTTKSTSTSTSTSTGVGGEGGEGGAGGQGGMSVCEAACDKLENECQLGELCGPPMQGYPFTCEPPSQSDCMFQCIEDHTCSEISNFFASLTGASMRACVGACDGAALCKQCISDANFAGNCTPELGVCAGDPVCTDWAGCAANCADAACFDACDTMHPAGAPLEGLYGCMCDTARCGEWCGDAITCPGP